VVYEEDLEGDYEEHYEDKTDDEDLEQESTESGSAPPVRAENRNVWAIKPMWS